MRTLGDLDVSINKVDFNYLIVLSLIQSSEDYVRLQKEQMMEGQREDGHPIFNINTGKDTYSPSYAKKKGKFKPIDLYDKGDFQGSIFLKVDDITDFTVDSADSKSGMLQENYGTKIFGLDNENKIAFKPIAQENLFNDIKNELSK